VTLPHQAEQEQVCLHALLITHRTVTKSSKKAQILNFLLKTQTHS